MISCGVSYSALRHQMGERTAYLFKHHIFSASHCRGAVACGSRQWARVRPGPILLFCCALLSFCSTNQMLHSAVRTDLPT
ncbi:hypothetical protein L227DRAFT_168580 [Lentinus tigrinus ALCF2SS1-6]|uniref:Uncharacterized protein n=1 Tax=Lentinus tigrinus ALCF2SS1-6 TaxID=1328759 RepID=A0A5C2S6E3_9APHY|nr:hypothetical protein L227DRAFT_168580 [Lentinus tigrinus ALCF2SS1-6]